MRLRHSPHGPGCTEGRHASGGRAAIGQALLPDSGCARGFKSAAATTCAALLQLVAADKILAVLPYSSYWQYTDGVIFTRTTTSPCICHSFTTQ